MQYKFWFALVAVLLIGGVVYWFYMESPDRQTNIDANGNATALVAGGCFWCVEADLEKLPGVIEAVSGYAGGTSESPTYENYAAGGHREVVLVTYDPKQLSFRQLLIYTIKHMDPTDGRGSFGDRGVEYAPALYFATTEEEAVIQEVLQDIESTDVYDATLAVVVEERPRFWPAEDYHQNYYQGTSALKYRFYRKASGRDAFIAERWGEYTGTSLVSPKTEASDATESTDAALQERLTPMQYRVTQQDGTEPAFQNEYHDNTEPGLYVDVVSGEPLFTSLTKYDSGTGWPSFTAPLDPEAVVLRPDKSLWSERIEVRSAQADSHLGHVFTDGPPEAGGLRYCLNSAALRFVPVADLEAEGYGEYTSLFEND